MKKTTLLNAVLLFAGFGMIASCKKDDHDHDENELITTVKVVATELGATSKTFTFKDADGPGGLAPTVFDSIILNANKNHSVSLQFLNESVSPAVDITNEVLAEAVDHQIYFTPSGVNLAVSNLDNDTKGLPLGLTSTWLTGGAGIGKMKITLKHKPDAKVAGDPITKGETDVEIEFPVRLK